MIFSTIILRKIPIYNKAVGACLLGILALPITLFFDIYHNFFWGAHTRAEEKCRRKRGIMRGVLDSACLRTRSPPLAHIISFSPYWPSGGLEITVLYQTLVEHTDEAGTEKKQGSELGRTVAQSVSVPLRKQQCTPTFQEGPN